MHIKTVLFYMLGEHVQAYRDARNRKVNIQEARENLNHFLTLVECLGPSSFMGTPSIEELSAMETKIAAWDDSTLFTRIDTIVDPDIIQSWMYWLEKKNEILPQEEPCYCLACQILEVRQSRGVDLEKKVEEHGKKGLHYVASTVAHVLAHSISSDTRLMDGSVYPG